MAFPSGTYAKYKRATGFFLQWLVRARVTGGYGAVGPGQHAKRSKKTKKKKRNSKPTIDTLNEYARIVSAIAQEPASLPAALSRQWPRAIAACECAITLRAQVAEFYTPTSSEDPHLHFLQRLKDWRAQLCDSNIDQLSNDQLPGSTSDANGKALDFSNYYDVLDLPDDFFNDKDEEDEAIDAVVAPKLSCKERAQLTEQPFQDDAALEVAYFLLELDELSNAVYEAFCDVKLGKKSLMEATVITLVAMDFAKTVIGQFQLCQPSVRNGDVLYELLKPSEEELRVEREQLERSEELTGSGPYQNVRATRIQVALTIRMLRRTVDNFPVKPNTQSRIMEGGDGVLYDEEAAPHQTTRGVLKLLHQQLRLLFNATVTSGRLDRFEFLRPFSEPVEQFFKTREISLQLVFVSLCWVQSVTALQGNAGLSRTISLSLQHQWDLEARLHEALKRIQEQRYWSHHSSGKTETLKNLLCSFEIADELISLARANPIVAGGFLLSNHMNYILVGTRVGEETTCFRAFAHLYSALRDRQLLDEIPFFEEFVEIYESCFFASSRDAATHGNFLSVYGAGDRKFRRTRQGRSKQIHSVTCRWRYIQSQSKVVQLLVNRDYEDLSSYGSPPTASWKNRLAHVAKMSRMELFETRLLSRDLLKVADDITDLFVSLRDGLSQYTEFTVRMNDIRSLVPGPDTRPDYQVLEEDVLGPILLLLDSMHIDGWATPGCVQGMRINSVAAVEVCERVVDILSARFNLNKPNRLTNLYFTLPGTPCAAIKFGDAINQHTGIQGSLSTCDVFLALMEMMTESPAALSEEQVATLKREVKNDPTLLSMVVTDPNVELSTLFHHVAAGRARDRRLVEWFIQMGALRYQPKHFQKPPFDDEEFYPSKNLCNYMAAHSAARAGLADIMELILEADFLRDMNKVTYHTKESLVHIAVRNDDRIMYVMLEERNADCRHKDASGKYVLDYTDNASWRSQIVRLTVWQHRAAEIQRKKMLEAEDKTIGARTPTDRQLAFKAADSNPSHKQLKAEKPWTETVVEKTMEVRRLEECSMPPSMSLSSRIKELSQSVDSLKEGAWLDEAEVVTALHVVDTIRASVEYFANSTRHSRLSRSVMRRAALDAFNALVLLTKIHRRLPALTQDLLPDDESPVARLSKRAGPAHAFGDFLAFAMHTVRVFQASRHPTHVQETLELLERRLLQIKPRDQSFLETVKSYLRQRRRWNIEPPAGSLPEAQRVFRWMLPTANGAAAIELLNRFRWFRCLMAIEDARPEALEKLKNEASKSTQGFGNVWICVGDAVVVAAHTSHELTSSVADVVRIADASCGVRFHAHNHSDNTTELLINGLTIRE